MAQNFNLIELLSKFSSLDSSGYLQISKELVWWKLYWQKGQLQYAEPSIQTLAQLKYYLLRRGWKTTTAALKDMPKSFLKSLDGNLSQRDLFGNAIDWLISEKYLDNYQFIQLIEDITQDSLECCLWLTEAVTLWHQDQSIPAWIEARLGNSTCLNLPDMVKNLQQRLHKWQNCGCELVSPHQRPYLIDCQDLNRPLPSGALSAKALNDLAQVMRRGLSLRQLAVALNQDELRVAQILSPYIQGKIIQLRTPQPPLDQLPHIPTLAVNQRLNSSVAPSADPFKIVCIDDSPTILSEIKRFLPKNRFEVTAINDPVQASAIIFRLEPDLILLDITMPRINGYKLCSLLRSSNFFQDTPIIMVTGNTGLIDKARAKLAGATDYLTKPFTQESLMNMVEKHLKQTKATH